MHIEGVISLADCRRRDSERHVSLHSKGKRLDYVIMSMIPYTIALLLRLASPTFAVSQPDPCLPGAASTLEINDCLADRLREERKRLGRYLGAVRRTLSADTTTRERLNEAQRAWETYVARDCDAVYSYWRDGSIRHAKRLLCSIDAVALRTHDLWASFLTYEDSTPPLLPEPKAGALSKAERDVAIDTVATPVRLTWKRLPASDALNPASARRQLPKYTAWAPAPQTWDVLPSAYASDGSPIGPFTLTTMNNESLSPIAASIQNDSPNSVTVTLTRKRSAIAFYERTFVREPDRTLAKLAVFNDGASIVEFTRVICGDRDRFDVRITSLRGDTESAGECTASAAVSPDGRYVFLENGIVDLEARELTKFPRNFPEFDQVVGWSKDGKRVALNAARGLILVTRAPSR